MDIISFNIVYVACQVGDQLNEYIYFFDKLKETFKFWENGCQMQIQNVPSLNIPLSKNPIAECPTLKTSNAPKVPQL
jgi:hypothetical protein